MKTGRKRNAQKKRWVKLPTLVSMISITMVLLLLGSVVLFALTANELSKSVRESLTVTVVLQDDIAVTEAMKKLNDRERSIINMRFYRGKTQMEIADEIGISQAQVSRIEKSALERIRKDL